MTQEIKTVNFMGDELVAIKENESGKIYVAVSWVCKGLKLDSKGQRNKIRKHPTLSKGWATLPLPSDGGCQETGVLEIDFLPLWLAMINPKLVGENVYEKLVGYQLKCKNILADAFLHNTNNPADNNSITHLPADFSECLRMLADKVDENEILKPKAEKYDTFLTAKNVQTMNEVAKCLHTGRNKLFEFLRNRKVLMENNLPYQPYIDNGYFVTKESSIWNGTDLLNVVQRFVTAKGVGWISDLRKKQLQKVY